MLNQKWINQYKSTNQSFEINQSTNQSFALEINKSIEKWTKTILSNKHRIEQLKQKKSILSIQDHVNQMSEVNDTIEHILKKNTLNITDTLETNKSIKESAKKIVSDKHTLDQMNPEIFLCVQDYVNRILKETGQIEQIPKNTPDATNALETDTSFKEFTLEQVKQIIEETKQIEQILHALLNTLVLLHHNATQFVRKNRQPNNSTTDTPPSTQQQ